MKHLLFLLLCTTLMACETTVEVDVPQYPAQLTTNMFFTPDSTWKVELSENRYILDTALFAPVSDANIRVLQQGQVVTSLDYQGESRFGNSIYTSEDNLPVIGEPYTLEVVHPALGTLLANSEVPMPESIIRATLDTSEVQLVPRFSDGTYDYAVTIRLDDPLEENFYSVSLIVRYDGFYSDDIDKDGEYEVWLEEFTLWLPIQSEDPIVSNPFNRARVELFFKDVSFNGKQYELTAYISSGLPNLNFYLEGNVLQENAYDREGNVIRYPGDTVSKQTFYAILRTTTEEYYQYAVTQDLQAWVENNPFAQPVQTFENIEGGLGIFAGYSQVEKKVTIK